MTSLKKILLKILRRLQFWKMYYAPIVSLEELARGKYLCIDNACRLYDDAQALIKSERYVGAVNALKLANEEIAKARLIDQAAMFENHELELWAWFWKAFSNHRTKIEFLQHDFHSHLIKGKGHFKKTTDTLLKSRTLLIYVDYNKGLNRFIAPAQRLPSPKDKEVAEIEIKYTDCLLRMIAIVPFDEKTNLGTYRYMRKDKGQRSR
jgi:AbiV family abortive infection protein